MALKQLFDNLLGRTHSLSTRLVYKTHFNGSFLTKTIDVQESIEVKKKNAAQLDKMFPKTAPHQLDNTDYRFVFLLDFAKKPLKSSLKHLVNSINENKNYTPHIREYNESIIDSKDDGRRRIYTGLKFCDWLVIDTHFAIEGQLDEFGLPPSAIKIFETGFFETLISHNGQERKAITDKIVVTAQEVDLRLQGILKAELAIFIKECIKLMSVD